MSDAVIVRAMSAAEYLDWERQQSSKHEYHLGEIFAMAGGSSPRHNLFSNAVGAELRAALRELGCHVLSSDQRIAATPGQRYVYADVGVVCGTVVTESGSTDVLANPTLIVEVLSKSTESYDRGVKWEAYQRLTSLTDYLLVSQSATRIEHFSRESETGWKYRVYEAGGMVRLTNGAQLAVDAIYAGAFALEGD